MLQTRSRAVQPPLGLYPRRSPTRLTLPEEEILVDNFAGGGGASTGIELALGRSVSIAVNHDRGAIETYKLNHPYAETYEESVWDVDPIKACAGRPVGVAWFSPDCKHYSSARGYKPVDKNIRGLAWVSVRWGKLVRPRLMFLENIAAFKSWGPVIPWVKDGVVQYDQQGAIKYVPDPARKGITFKRFTTTVKNLGYDVEWKILNAANYGAPTNRHRLFMVARCDQRPIVWPEPTHGSPDSEGVLSGQLLPFRTAAECIDFTTPFRSIFERSKDLADNTSRRLVRGLWKFVIAHPSPFVLPYKMGSGNSGHRAEQCSALMAPYITRICQQGFGGSNVASVNQPLSTIVTKNEHCLIAVFLTKFYGTATGSDVRNPMPTITAGAGGGHMAEVRALLTRYQDEAPGLRLNGLDPIKVMINGELYVIVDIGLRMLSPRELAYAQFGWAPAENGMSERAIAEDYEFTGTQADQVAKIGNSVPPLVAAALVRANVFGESMPFQRLRQAA